MRASLEDQTLSRFAAHSASAAVIRSADLSNDQPQHPRRPTPSPRELPAHDSGTSPRGTEVKTHDPRQVIEDVRSHLAAHDRRVAFLFGAGTSSGVNVAPNPPAGQKRTHEPLIPGVEALTKLCQTAVANLGKPQAAAWTALVKQCETGGRIANVETVLSSVRTKIDAIGEGESLVGLERKQLQSMEQTICTTIADAVIPDEAKIPNGIPHDDFAAWVKKANRTASLEVFTTNYDVLLERSLEAARVPVFDAFVGSYEPFFYPECLDDDGMLPTNKWVRLWKLHGSVNWHYQRRGDIARIIRSQPSKKGELIFPSHRKYDESRKLPYMAYMDRLSRVLNSDYSLLVTCGYSFGDEHINAILYGALDSRNTANVIALVFGDLKETDHIVDAARRRQNLTVLGRNGGVISGIWGLWKLTKSVDEKTCAFIDPAFDSDAVPGDAASQDCLTGSMRLGDFNWFGRFIGAMGPVV